MPQSVKKTKRRSIRPQLVAVPCPWCGETSEASYQVRWPARLEPATFNSKTFSARRLPDGQHYQLVTCRHDGLTRSTPVLPPSIATKLYQASTVTYQAEVPYLVESYLEQLTPLLSQLPPAAKILEIGCGSGFVLQALQAKGYRVTGLEPSQSAIRAAQPAIRRVIQPGILPAVKLLPHTYDAILLFQTLDHLSDVFASVQSIYQAVKPGGYFFSLHHDLDFWLVKVLGERHPIVDVEHTFLFSAETTRKLCTLHGFQVQQLWSPSQKLSLAYLIHLCPLPRTFKKSLTSVFGALGRRLAFKVRLGNIAVIAQKPDYV